MMKRKLLYGIGLLAVFFMMSCEDLEDTYDEWSGDGMVRYVGKAGDVEVAPGWERLRVTWKNGNDANVKYTKVTWQSDKESGLKEKYVPLQKDKASDTLWIENLDNALYTIRVSNLTADSTESFTREVYGLPYTSEHENLSVISRGIINFYPLGNRMAVTLDEKNDYLKEVMLHYIGTDGNKHEWNILENMSDTLEVDQWGTMIQLVGNMFLLPEEGVSWGINFNEPLTITRKGRVAECLDEIPFTEVTLEKGERVWSTHFTLWMNQLYGPDWESRVNTIEEIDLDYDLATFEDLFYLPALKQVNLGKNRYLCEALDMWGMKGVEKDYVSLTDEYKALMTLQYLKTTRGVETNVYNGMYFSGKLGDPDLGEMSYTKFLQQLGKIDADLLNHYTVADQTQPGIVPLAWEDWALMCSDTTYSGNNNTGSMGWLLDDDSKKCFSPGKRFEIKTYELTFDMKTPQMVHGFKFVQAHPDAITEDYKKVLGYLLSAVKIEVSNDAVSWTNATYVDGYITVGNNAGEATYITIPEELRQEVRYIRLSMANNKVDEMDGVATYSLKLGDFIPYTEP